MRLEFRHPVRKVLSGFEVRNPSGGYDNRLASGKGAFDGRSLFGGEGSEVAECHFFAGRNRVLYCFQKHIYEHGNFLVGHQKFAVKLFLDFFSEFSLVHDCHLFFISL